jgi:EpsI family protein
MRKTFPFFILACAILILASGYTKWLIKEVSIPLMQPLDQVPIEFGEFVGENVSPTSQEFNYNSSDSQISRIYTAKGKAVPINVFLGYWESENETKRISSPRYTKEGWGYYWAKTKTLTTGLDNRMQLKEFLNERGEEKELVYYCYIVNGKVVPDEYRFRFLKAANSLLYRKNNAALVRVSTPITSDLPVEAAEPYIEDFIKDFLPIVREYLPK